jgi:hypothetical protein
MFVSHLAFDADQRSTGKLDVDPNIVQFWVDWEVGLTLFASFQNVIRSIESSRVCAKSKPPKPCEPQFFKVDASPQYWLVGPVCIVEAKILSAGLEPSFRVQGSFLRHRRAPVLSQYRVRTTAT